MQTPADAIAPAARPCNVLLLTATVQPPADVRSLARSDPRLRLADYLDAFDFYLDALRNGAADAIVLCENSGFDLGVFRARAHRLGLGRRVECLSFRGLDHPGHYGRGYGEFKLVDYAMLSSALIASAGPGLVVWKLTGRYRVRNIAQLVASRLPAADLYCHAHNWPRAYVDLHVMAWTRAGHLQVVRGAYRHLRQDHTPMSAERRFREWIDKQPAQAGIVRRFAHVPLVDGVRAGDNRDFRDLRARYLVRWFALRWLPQVWV